MSARGDKQKLIAAALRAGFVVVRVGKAASHPKLRGPRGQEVTVALNNKSALRKARADLRRAGVRV